MCKFYVETERTGLGGGRKEIPLRVQTFTVKLVSAVVHRLPFRPPPMSHPPALSFRSHGNRWAVEGGLFRQFSVVLHFTHQGK